MNVLMMFHPEQQMLVSEIMKRLEEKGHSATPQRGNNDSLKTEAYRHVLQASAAQARLIVVLGVFSQQAIADYLQKEGIKVPHVCIMSKTLAKKDPEERLESIVNQILSEIEKIQQKTE